MSYVKLVESAEFRGLVECPVCREVLDLGTTRLVVEDIDRPGKNNPARIALAKHLVTHSVQDVLEAVVWKFIESKGVNGKSYNNPLLFLGVSFRSKITRGGFK